MKPIFFYGSLRDAELLSVVVDRPVAVADLVPATAPGTAVVRLRDERYPILVDDPAGRAEGVLFAPRTQRELDRLAFFEDHEYVLAPLAVETAAGRRPARAYRPSGTMIAGGGPWDYADWRARDRALALEAGRELMALFGRLPMARIDEFWSAIKTRARARVRAAAAAPPGRDLRRGFTAAADLRPISEERVWQGYLAVDRLGLEHRRFDGGWSGPVGRVAVSWGDAVTLLPYDPRRDAVLLLEQFRVGPVVRGDPRPWCVEVIAGRIDADEDAEAAARREAREEAGLEIGRVERLPGYYPTPGIASEHLDAFVGEADLAGADGVYGLDGEAEDIRAFTLGFADAMAALDAGAINTGPAMVPLLWLARHRERLRQEWG